MEVGITGHNFGREPSKDHSTKVWFKLAQWLQRSWLKCEKLTNGRTTDRRRTLSGDNSSPDPFGSGELKMKCHENWHLTSHILTLNLTCKISYYRLEKSKFYLCKLLNVGLCFIRITYISSLKNGVLLYQPIEMPSSAWVSSFWLYLNFSTLS